MLRQKSGYTLLVLGGIIGTFFTTRLDNLTKLPVFADEAIYIRWAQLMNQDFARYAFFPLQDGKTPLHAWLLTQTIAIKPLDPLWGARVLSVLAGFITLLALMHITVHLAKSKLATMLAAILYLILPFTLFHDRMALIDPLLTLFLALSFASLLKLIQTTRATWAITTGIFWGLALLTKLPALFFLPVFLVAPLFFQKHLQFNKKLYAFIIIALVIGSSIFLSLKFTPVFHSLFSRGQDFTFTIQEILQGEWRYSLSNIVRFGSWFVSYYTLGGLALIPALFITKKRRSLVGLACMALIFLLPFLVFGRVVSARYLLPTVIFIIPLMATVAVNVWQRNKKIASILFTALTAQSLWFGAALILNPAATPFPEKDKEQYLSEWSAGYGIPEVRDFLRERSQLGPVQMLTEGYFGTLPDGLLMYFDLDPSIKNITIHGIGQPVQALPDTIDYAEKETFLLVNEHRLKMTQEELEECCILIDSYPKPLNGPHALLFKVRQHYD